MTPEEQRAWEETWDVWLFSRMEHGHQETSYQEAMLETCDICGWDFTYLDIEIAVSGDFICRRCRASKK
jgi:hypothetical protein